MKRSIGEISSLEFKRRSIINEINHIAYTSYKSSEPSFYTNNESFNLVQNDILHMELDPRESKCLLTICRNHKLIIYDVSKELKEFEVIANLIIPHKTVEKSTPPNSVHWLWDSTIFSVCSKNNIHFWDSSTCKIIETIEMPTEILNHLIAAKKYSSKKYVAATGIEGHVFIIDMHHGTIVMTLKNIEKIPMRAICWHLNNELQYITGNDNGNIYLWDIRFQKKIILKYTEDSSFSKKSSHSNSVIALHMYNDGNSIISVDNKGVIKTWETNSGHLHPNYYECVQLDDFNKTHICKNYQFAVTDQLKEDIAFLPSKVGMRMIDIVNAKNLPNSNDTSFPVHCATYDSMNSYVYGSTNNLVKLWSPQFQSKNYQEEITL